MGQFTEPILNPTAQPALTKEDMAQYILRGGAQLSAATYPDQLRELAANVILPTGLNYVTQIRDPQRITTNEPLTPEWATLMKKHSAAKLESFESNYEQLHNMIGAVEGMATKFPDIAAQAGVDESFWQNVLEQGKSVSKKGLGALQFLLTNLDRGRGAVIEYAKNIQEGAAPEDATRRAYDVLRGSDRGWVLTPEKMGPTGTEMLRAMGYDDSLGTKVMGFALDVAVDPVNLLGIGIARKGLPIGAHQILNEEGRQVWLASAKRIANSRGFEEVANAPFEIQQAIQGQAHAEMRQLINSNEQAARAYLDMGGLKIAGMSLVHAPLRKETYVRNGKVMVSNTSQSLARAFGSTALAGIDKMGSWAATSAPPLPKRLVDIMKLLPANIREAGQSVALILNRTNPLAGRDWKIFKQAEYYDTLGFRRATTMQGLQKVFGQFNANELEQMTWAIERNTVEQLPQPMQQAVQKYVALTDASLIEEVKRGIMKPEWSPEKRARFIQWMTDPNSVFLEEAEQASFLQVRLPRYVPHIYRDVVAAKKFETRGVGPRTPVITEGFTEKRLFATLEEAQNKGLVPELNLFVLAAHRLTTADQATTTFDFLQKAAIEFGEVSPEFVRKSLRIADDLQQGEIPHYTHQRYETEAVTGAGLLPGDAARHLQIAREIARQPYVRAELLAKLDDNAKREFLLHRFRVTSPRKAHQVWQKYVQRPTEMGLYDGLRVAPGEDAIAAAARARELYDPLYGGWAYLSVAGKGDPAVLHRLLLPDAIVRDLERMKARTLPPEVQTLLRAFDTVNFWWKASVTLPFPAFHFRNKLTNILNSSLEAGLGVVMDRPTMMKVMWGEDGQIRTATGLTYTYKQIRDLAARHGVFMTDYHRADIGETIEEAMRLKIGKNKNVGRINLPGGEKRAGIQSIANPFTAPVTAMREGAAALENSDRLLVFINSLKRGLTPELAAERVSRVLFDWQDLSAVEKGWFRRIIPFYTWMRKNLALQVNVVATQPTRVSMFEKVRSNFSAESDDEDVLRSHLERQLLPQALEDELGIRLEVTPRVSTWALNFDLPVTDLDKLWRGSQSRSIREWFVQVNPALRGLVESMAEQDFFSGKKVLEFGANDKMYEFILQAPDPIKRYLEVEQKVVGDDTTVRVNGAQYRKLMWGLTLSGMSRAWSTVGNVTNPNVNLSHRLFQLFTGGKIRKFDAEAEMTKRVDKVLKDPEQGLVQRLRSKKSQMEELLLLKGGRTTLDDALDPKQEMPLPDDIKSELEILTPIFANELEERDGIQIP